MYFIQRSLELEKYIKVCLLQNFDQSLVNGTKMMGRDNQHWGADVHRTVADLYLELLDSRSSP